ncbi:MAG: DUF4349 domain-containing protein [Caldibacillus sp.]
MKRVFMLTIMLLFGFFLVACGVSGSERQTELEEGGWQVVEPDHSGSGGSADSVIEDRADSVERDVMEENAVSETSTPDQKIIYTADIHLRVKNLQKTMNEITGEVQRLGGYIVHSNTYTTHDDLQQGEVTVRVPQEHFTSFIADVEKMDGEVLSRNVQGQDVTEEYVDLESRLKSLRAQEERLLQFMEQAENTEDLLKISKDLTDVQEKIDSLTGRLRYLENRVEMATVTVRIEERNVEISGLDKDLNTWEKTVDQFKRSIDWLIQGFSWLIILVVGNLPIIALLAIILVGAVFFIKKVEKAKPKNDEEGTKSQKDV